MDRNTIVFPIYSYLRIVVLFLRIWSMIRTVFLTVFHRTLIDWLSLQRFGSYWISLINTVVGIVTTVVWDDFPLTDPYIFLTTFRQRLIHHRFLSFFIYVSIYKNIYFYWSKDPIDLFDQCFSYPLVMVLRFYLLFYKEVGWNPIQYNICKNI